MPDLLDLVTRWWKQILSLVLITLIITAIIVFTKRKEYLGMTTALPAPTYATDKAAVFSQNMQVLYPGLGTADDLDMILGTAKLDTVYLSVAQDLNLTDYYAVDKKDPDALQKAAAILKRKTKVTKSDYGELKVKAWDGNKYHAADMANGVMHVLQRIHQGVQSANNELILSKLKEDYDVKQQEYQKLESQLLNDKRRVNVIADETIHDTVVNSGISKTVQASPSKLNSIAKQMEEYEQLINQYQLMVNAKPQSLVIIENARPGLWPDKPKPKQTMLAAALLSLFFGLIAAVILERRRILNS